MSLTAEQIAHRIGRLGGSDAAAALGMHRYKTAYQLYLEKRGEIDISDEENNAIRMGRLLEPVVRQVYSNDTGFTVRAPTTLTHPKFDWMIAHVDGVIAEHNRGWEGKSCAVPNPDEWGEPGSDQVPQEYLLQTQQYMIVTGLPAWDLSVITGRFRVRHYTIEADLELHEMMIEGEAEFMRRVREGDPPPLDYEHRTALDLIKKIYPGTNGLRIEAHEEAIDWREAMQSAAEREKQAKAEKEAYRARLLEFMGESALLAFPDGKCFRRQITERAAYTVDATKFVDARFVNDPSLSKSRGKRR